MQCFVFGWYWTNISISTVDRNSPKINTIKQTLHWYSSSDSWCHNTEGIHTSHNKCFLRANLFSSVGCLSNMGVWCDTSNTDMAHRAACLWSAAQLGTLAPESARWNVMKPKKRATLIPRCLLGRTIEGQKTRKKPTFFSPTSCRICSPPPHPSVCTQWLRSLRSQCS